MGRSGLYLASRVRHAARWRELREKGWPVSSSWIDWQEPSTKEDWAILWETCRREAASSAALLAFAEGPDRLRGAILEMGIALQSGVPVLYVGSAEVLGSILDCPGVYHFSSIAEALGWAVEKGLISPGES